MVKIPLKANQLLLRLSGENTKTFSILITSISLERLFSYAGYTAHKTKKSIFSLVK